jgi:hypothetical protein
VRIVGANNAGGRAFNPAPFTVPVNVTAGGALDIGVNFIGHVVFRGDELAAPAPADDGTLLVAMSNPDDTFRNLMGFVDLTDASAHPGALRADSYLLQHDGIPFPGDVCGVVRGDDELFAIGVDDLGAHVFRLGLDGQQRSDVAVVSIPHPNPPELVVRPCRGVYVNKGGQDQLYLVQFDGSLDTSAPHPFLWVNATTASVVTPFDDRFNFAWRAITIDAAGDRIALVDMSWSKDSQTNNRAGCDSAPGLVGCRDNRVFPVTLAIDGTPTLGAGVGTGRFSDDRCDSQLHWPSGARFATVGGSEALLVGHDAGIAVLDPATFTERSALDLSRFGTVFTQVEPSPDGKRLYALPVCKSLAGTFRLPFGAGTERADQNLIAVLDPSGTQLAVADTGIDIDGDGSADDGIDVDYYHLKAYLRSFDTTMTLPPVVYTAPQMAVGNAVIALRGTGIQGNGATSISSSGLGQVQDIGLFDIDAGRGILFGGYAPFFDGFSSDAGRGTGIWGYDASPGREASVGAVVYLPPSP